jgi:AcrR family transcriptional regulator
MKTDLVCQYKNGMPMQNIKKPKEIWLSKGLKILKEEGPNALSIDNLAVQTQKTKGSFYHHFKNRETYIEALLTYYEKKTTMEILHAVNEETEQAAQLKKLTALVFQISSRLELVVRAWALYEPVVKGFQDRIDQKRLAHLTQIYRSTLRDDSQAQALAFKNYSLYIGLQQLRHLHAENTFKKLLKTIFLT